MKKLIVAGLIVSFMIAVPGAGAKTAAEFSEEWESLQFGMYIHFGIETFSDSINGNEAKLPEPSEFRPKQVDVQQWAKTAKDVGAKYIYLTVKHECGFCLWDSTHYEYDVGCDRAWKTDILGDLIAVCEAEGIKVGIHYSISDFYNESEFRKKGSVSELYFSIIKKHTVELHKTYPAISIHRFDWGNRLSDSQRRELHELVEKLNPDCLVSSTFPKKVRETFEYPSPGLAEGSFIPMEMFETIPKTKTWMWAADCKLTPAVDVYRKYLTARKNGANFCVSVAPDREGNIPQDQLDVLAEVKKMIDDKVQLDPVPAPKTETKDSGGGTDQQYQEQLKKLKSLYEDGLISKKIYEEKQKELVNSLLSGVAGSTSEVQGNVDSMPAGDAGSSPKAQGNVDLKNGLVLHLGFNEDASTAVDDSGHENHGKVKKAEWTKDGRIGGAYRFDQKKRNHAVIVEDSDSLDCTAVTVAAWIKTSDVGSGWTRIINKNYEKGYDLNMGGPLKDVKENADRWFGKSLFKFSGNRWVGTKRIVADGEWHHLIASCGDGIARIYVDGKLDGERKLKNEQPIQLNDIDLVIGNKHPQEKNDPQTMAFDGLIDEVRVYNRVLSQDEVTALFELKE